MLRTSTVMLKELQADLEQSTSDVCGATVKR
jgi:hypothetical protein